jgi:GNAT superfamily N-acetyltransferase
VRGYSNNKIVLHLIKEEELLESKIFKEFQSQESGLSAYINDDILFCYQQDILYSFLAYTLDEIDHNNRPHRNSKFYLDKIWTVPEYRNRGYGTIVLNGLFSIASKEKREIKAILATQQPQWFENRGFRHFDDNSRENEFEISYIEIKFNDFVIYNIKNGEIICRGIPFP